MSGEAGEFRCYMCRAVVEEDQSALPKKDSRLLMARFNEQMEALYMLLREVEDVKLAPSLLEPEPTDISHLQRLVYFYFSFLLLTSELGNLQA